MSIRDIFKSYNLPLFIVLLLLLYFPLFLHLTLLPIRIWDESILGINAYEMLHNGNYIVTHFNGAPEMSNCKPPLVIWCMVICSKIWGFDELALRLPSALAALVLCTYLYFKLTKYTGSSMFGFIAVLVLVTCQGYVRNHVTRTGEYDSMLVLFTTLFSLHVFLAADTDDEKKRWWHILWVFVFVTLAVLTKGVAALMLGPGLLIYVIARKKLLTFFKTSSLYFGILIFIVFGLGYYLLRETMNPGYLHAVWINELGGRYATVNEHHTANIWAYLNEIVTWHFTSYLVFFPLAILVSRKWIPEKMKRMVNFSLIAGGVFLLVISLSKTKLSHYNAPLFPFLAIITASFFYFVYEAINNYFQKHEVKRGAVILAGLCIAAILSVPYMNMVKTVYFPKGDYWEQDFSDNCIFFQRVLQGRQQMGGYKPVFNEYYVYGKGNVLKCYEHALNDNGIYPKFIGMQEVTGGDSIVVFNSLQLDTIKQQYEVKSQDYLKYCNSSMVVLGMKKEIGPSL